ncbi:hypothetical protein J2W27_001658 [Variovorax boronicumulans]|uniref:hypothetical protein n=1 Tax=Variovorax boronicumulans TaxID=436515 RepID=UPI0027876EC0|nr:hypothetical protein [Variovorax boronicumulans]MDP9909556.1 hypothetical protein [Variovorax boronicumulans]
MSFLMVVRRKGSPEVNSSFPVATEEFFARVWEPAIEFLGSRWLGLFSTGVEIHQSDIPEVLVELAAMRDWSDLGATDAEKSHALSRSLLVTRALEEAQDDATVISIWVG